jgi:hypothetical protein
MVANEAIMQLLLSWWERPLGWGLYWPTALADAQDLVRRCKGCQLFAK